MNLVPYSWNGYLINDWWWSNPHVGKWSSEFKVGQRGNLSSSPVYSPVAFAFPKLSSTQLGGHEITITFHQKDLTLTLAYLREQLKGWFNINDHNIHTLIAQDTEDSNRQWYLTGIPDRFDESGIAEESITLALSSPVWKVVTPSTTGVQNVAASPKTQVLTVLGDVGAQPIFTIKPNNARTGTFAYKRYVPLYNNTTKAFPFAVSTVDITFGGLNTAALVAGGKMLASGADVRFSVDSALQNYWYGGGGINTTTTLIWANVPHSAGLIGALKTALPNNGTTVDVAFTVNASNLATLKGLAQAGNTTFIIGSEMFTYTKANVDIVNYKIKSCLRAQKQSSFAAHSAAAAIYWVEHDCWLYYGNAAADPYPTDDTKKPLIDLTNSTNTSWVWSTFYDTSSPRPAAWSPMVSGSITNGLAKAILTSYYTADALAFANPATELGLQMQTIKYNNVEKAETATLSWYIYHPAGFTSSSMSGKKYMYNLSSWPAKAGLYKTNDLKAAPIVVWNEAVPGVVATPSIFTHNGVTLSGTYLFLILLFSGSIANKALNQGYLQGDTVTLPLGSGVLKGSLGAEIANYQLTPTITNSDTGESIYINATLSLQQVLTIDCGKKTAILDDGTNLFNAISLSQGRVNTNWLDIGIDSNQKFTGSATIVYTETGVADESLTIAWEDSSL